MAVRHYNKLVRTKIPYIIESKGEECGTRMISGKELTSALIMKAKEEIGELSAATTREEMATELADLQETLQAIEQHALRQGRVDQALRDTITELYAAMASVAFVVEGIDVAGIKDAKRQKKGGFLLDDGQGVLLEWASENPKEIAVIQDVMRFRSVLLEAGVSSRTGRVYTEECLVEMQRQLKAQIEEGKAFIADTTADGTVQMDDVYGQLDHVDITEEDGRKKLTVEG